NDAVRAPAGLIHPCAPITGGIGIVFVAMILTPFPHIPMDIVNPKRIWLLPADGVSRNIEDIAIPGHRVKITRRSAVILRATCIFPLGFRRQAVLLASLFCQPATEIFRIISGDSLYR